MKLLITGATGYIGNKLSLEAAAKNFKVHILVRNPESSLIPRHPNIFIFKGDVTDIDSVRAAMFGCQQVIHSAAVTKFWNKDNSIFYKVNVEGTRNVLDSALQLGIKKLVYTSTGAVIGPSDKIPMNEKDPRLTSFENDYEISKYWGEELVKEYCRRGLFAIIVSTSRVYGPGINADGNTIERFLRKIFKMHVAFVPQCTDVLANYAFLDDVIKGHFLALEKGLGGEKYILGGENISYGTFFKVIKEFSGNNIWLITVPKSLMLAWSYIHMMVYRFAQKHTNISPKIIHRLSQNRALSCEKAKRQLGYAITPFKEGLKKTILHLQKNNYE